MQNVLLRVFSAALFLCFPLAVFAANGVTYHGRLLKANGDPVDASVVEFKIQVRSPGAENCLMYQETHTRNMTSSNGVFAITLNDGTASPANSEPFSLDRVFQNRGVFTFAAGKCSLGTTYTPQLTDGRVLYVEFNDGTFAPGLWEALPPQAINSVPMSIESMTVGGYGSGSMLRVHDGSGLPDNTVPALTSTQYSNFLSLLAGSSSLYLNSSSPLNGANLTASSVDDGKLASGISGSKISGNISGNAAGFTGSLNGDVTGTQTTTVVGKIQGRAVDNAAPTDGQVLKWSGLNSRWEPSADTGGIAVESDPTVPANIKDGIDWTEVSGKPATFAPSAHGHYYSDLQNQAGAYLNYMPNNAACADGEILKWNNAQSRWECGVDAGGAGMVTSVGISAPVTNSGSGTAPVLGVSNATTSAVGVVELATDGENAAGVVVQGNDSRLSDARAPNGAASGDLTGSYPAPTIANNAVTSAKINDGSVAPADLNFAGVQAVNTGIVVRDGTQFHNKVCAANEVLIWTVANGWSCSAAVLTESDPTVPANIKDGIDWTEVSGKPATFAPSAHTHVIDEITSAVSKYFTYKPNNVQCADGGVMKWSVANQRWECGTDAGSAAGIVASVNAGTNVSMTGPSTDPVVNVADASTSVKGVVELATNGENAAGVAVQGNDSRLSDARTPTAHTHIIDEITSAASKYFTYKPNNVACTTGQVLKWTAANQWECAADSSNVGTVTGVTA